MDFGEMSGWVVAVLTLIVMVVQVGKATKKDKTEDEKCHGDKHTKIEKAILVLQTNYENIENRIKEMKESSEKAQDEIKEQIREVRDLIIKSKRRVE